MQIMKRNIIAAALLAVAGAAASAGPVERPAISFVEGMINVDMDMRLAAQKVKANEILILSPCLVNGTDTLWLDRVGIYGRTRYIQHQRGNDFGLAAPQILFKAGKVPADYHYRRQMKYQPWLDGANLDVKVERYGCRSCEKGEPEIIRGLGVWHAPVLNTRDAFIYMQPKVETEKVRDISGRANVEFPVNQTVLLSDFRGNYAELQSIRRSIDSVKNDKDVTIKMMAIKGFASPEGSYANNERLAKGRTEALTRYVENLYQFRKGFIRTSWEAEDWNGLRDWVAASNILNKEGILRIIDDRSLAPDVREARLRNTYPVQFQELFNTVYPTLRHSDYKIEYVVRSYTDPKEILQIMKTRPGNLSLNELFAAAQTLEPGSPEFNEVMEVAVRLYPEDPVANLNAANAALQKNDLTAAAKYLAKAGDSADAVYTRGLYEAIAGNYDAAKPLLEKAGSLGVKKASALLAQLDAPSQCAAAKE